VIKTVAMQLLRNFYHRAIGQVSPEYQSDYNYCSDIALNNRYVGFSWQYNIAMKNQHIYCSGRYHCNNYNHFGILVIPGQLLGDKSCAIVAQRYYLIREPSIIMTN